MNRHEIDEIIKRYKFELAGAIYIEEKSYGPSPLFELFDEFEGGAASKLNGWVYLWVYIINNHYYDICYVGKAGKTIKNRCIQHMNGARLGPSGSNKGRLNAVRMRDCMLNGGRIELYVRKAGEVEILGENICIASSEEEAMIQKCIKKGAHLWNQGAPAPI